MRLCTFHTKISDSIKNYIHHGGNQPHEEVGGGYIYIKQYDSFILPVVELIDIILNKTL